MGQHLRGAAVRFRARALALSAARGRAGPMLAAAACALFHAQALPAEPAARALRARIVVASMPAAQGIRQVGRFHTGGPFTGNPEFLMRTQPGRVLDPERLLVALGTNLGAAMADTVQAPGVVLSIDTRAATDTQPIVLPRDFAAARRSSAGAPVQLYSAQSAPYLNASHNRGAATARYAAVSGPRYLSINNAFGRPWIANAPYGTSGAGSETVVDPDGAPLDNAPSSRAGGVFAGDATPRSSVPTAVPTNWFNAWWARSQSAQLTPGTLDGGAFGTAFLGTSPDGSGFAVFAVVTGTGAIVQVHVQDGVDGLAPPGTLDLGGRDPGVVGMAFKWNARPALYVADPGRDAITVVRLGNDSRHFVVERTEHLASRWLSHPVDLAAAVPEIANPRFSSHTTLASDSDLYVANRGDGSLLRLRQDGQVLARARIVLPDGTTIGADRLRSIAVSADAQKIWVVAQRARGDDDSLLIELPSFDERSADASSLSRAQPLHPDAKAPSKDAAGDPRQGEQLFARSFEPANRVGARFNAATCAACHPRTVGVSEDEELFARRVARLDPRSGRAIAVDGEFSSIVPRRVDANGTTERVPVPRGANAVSLRMPISLSTAGSLDDIDDAVIEAQAVPKGDGIRGRVHRVTGADGTRRIGRYGWKADVVSLDTMVAQALRNELGIDEASGVRAGAMGTHDRPIARSIADYLRSRTTPAPQTMEPGNAHLATGKRSRSAPAATIAERGP